MVGGTYKKGLLLKRKIIDLKNKIEYYESYFSKEDYEMIKPILGMFNVMIESNISEQKITHYLNNLEYPIKIIEEKISKFEKKVL